MNSLGKHIFIECQYMLGKGIGEVKRKMKTKASAKESHSRSFLSFGAMTNDLI